MRCRFAFLALLLLLAYGRIDDALAGDGTSSKPRTAHSGQSHAISPRHHTLGSDGNYGTYRSLRLRARSEWRQAQHRGNAPPTVRTATR